jgi:cbb3-type cytochrome oxidase subunit 3
VFGVSVGMPALAVLVEPAYDAQYMPEQEMKTISVDGNYMTMGKMVMPCSHFEESGNMMYSKGGCSSFGVASTDHRMMPHSMHGWFALMFVITVAMVWVILLLLIGILWHMLKKHRKGH